MSADATLRTAITNSVLSFYEPLAPSTKYAIEKIDPETMQDLWEGLTDGRDLIFLWQRDYSGGDDQQPLPDSLNRLFDDVLGIPTNLSGTQSLRDDLIDQFGWEAYEGIVFGMAEPARPLETPAYVQGLYIIAKQLYRANRGVVPTWFRLNGLISALRNWFYILPGARGSSWFDRWLGDAIRHRQPTCPLSWLPAATFEVSVTIDYPTDEPFEKHAPPGWWASEPEPSEYRYLAKEDEDPERSVWAAAMVVEYHKILSFDEFKEFAELRRLTLSQSLSEAQHYFGRDLQYNPWGLPPMDMIDRGYPCNNGASNRCIDVLMDVYVTVLPQGTPSEKHSLDDAQAMTDELEEYVNYHWGLR